jgi:hypothetical protein
MAESLDVLFELHEVKYDATATRRAAGRTNEAGTPAVGAVIGDLMLRLCGSRRRGL